MKRREFLKAAAVAGAAAALNPKLLFGQQSSQSVIAAVRNGEPAAMLDSAMSSLGGMRRFVRSGQSVVIKPNASWNVPPENAGNTNPQLLERLIEHVRDAGASRVIIVDNALQNADRIYSTSGLGEAIRRAGAQIAPASSEGYYQSVNNPQGRVVRNAAVHEAILEADVFINVPILKHHSSTLVTSAMKNLMGMIWDRWYLHRSGLNQGIADLALLRKPDLNIVDAYNVLMTGGPNASASYAQRSLKKMLLASTDIVAIDAAAIRIWGATQAQVPYIAQAQALGLGTANLDSVTINRIVL